MKAAVTILLVLLLAGCTITVTYNNDTNGEANDSGTNIINGSNDDNNVVDDTVSGNNTVINDDVTDDDTANNTVISTNGTGNLNNTVVSGNTQVQLTYTNWTDGVITLSIPSGWTAVSYGACATKSFIVYDPSKPIRQVFYFSEVGPLYTSQAQKDNDVAYEAMGGYAIPYVESPVVSPLTAENFLNHFKEFAETAAITQIAPLAPKIYDVQVISSEASTQTILPSATDAQTIRALFKQDSVLGEGLFYVETYDFATSTLGYVNLGYGTTFIGLTAADDEFMQYETVLNHVINSYSISESYVASCIQSQNQAAEAAQQISETLSQTSDIIMDVWDNRQHSEDILSEKWSDTILGYDRVYDPSTGEVYRVDNNFYDYYNTHRDNYDMSNLEQLPENDWSLWTDITNPETDIH